MLYKVLRNGSPCHGGIGRWYLPEGDQPGAWMPPIKDLILCERGYHLCRPMDLVFWLDAEIYEAEARGELLEGADKIVVGQARLLRQLTTWTEETAKRFAYDCAERVYVLAAGVQPSTILAASDGANAGVIANHIAADAAWIIADAVCRGSILERGEAWGRAWHVERSWQTERLFAYLRGEVCGEEGA